jgi:hypothetical protein
VSSEQAHFRREIRARGLLKKTGVLVSLLSNSGRILARPSMNAFAPRSG